MNGWMAIDENIADHPKFLAVGEAASWSWLRALGYCNRQRTNGKIPKSALKLLRISDRILAKLLEVRLLDRDGEDFKIHDFEDWQRTREEIEAKQQSQRDRWRRWKERQDYKRQSNADSKRVANALANAPLTDPQDRTGQDSKEERQKDWRAASPARPPVPRVAKLPNPDHARVMRAFSETFERVRGVKPKLGGKDGTAANRLLETMSGDEAVSVIEAAFRDPWFASKEASLAAIAANPNRFLGKTPQSATRMVAAAQVQPVPENGPLWKVGGGS